MLSTVVESIYTASSAVVWRSVLACVARLKLDVGCRSSLMTTRFRLIHQGQISL